MVFLAASSCSAQQKFPLRPGEWQVMITESSSNNAPIVVLFCMNDDTWQKAINQNPYCSIQNFITTSTGASYTLSCTTRVIQMIGKGVITFDGMEHMTDNDSFDMTSNGTTTHTTSIADYRWKSATCSPNDVNLRQRRTR